MSFPRELGNVMDTEGNIVIGSRGSRLALVQAEWTKGQIETAFPELAVTIKTITTTGDKVLDTALDKIGGKGLFTKEIESALLAGEIDLAVHSLKDLPTELPDGLAIGAVTCREDPHDALVTKEPGLTLETLPQGAHLGTGSLRRKAQALSVRPDLKVSDLRGNLDTRLSRIDEGRFDAIVLACAGLHRLGREDRISQVIPFTVMAPAVGQGALGIEIRDGDERTGDVVAVLNDEVTRACVTAERALLGKLEGGCHVPIGAIAEMDGETIRLRGVVASLDGEEVLRTEAAGSPAAAHDIGLRAAEQLLAMGADRILEEVAEN
jgi:hydroxymethylbilane synthase